MARPSLFRCMSALPVPEAYFLIVSRMTFQVFASSEATLLLPLYTYLVIQGNAILQAKQISIGAFWHCMSNGTFLN